MPGPHVVLVGPGAAGIGGVSLALLLAAAPLAISKPAATPPASSAARESGRAASKGTLAAKERVSKPTSPPAPGGADHHDDDSDSDSGGCFDNCFFDFGTSLVESPTPPPAPPPVATVVSLEALWVVGASGWVCAPAEVDSVDLWDAPADPEHPGVGRGRIAHGTHVTVVETHAMASGFWTRVRPFEGVEPNGWIPATLLSPEPLVPPGAEAPAVTPAAGSAVEGAASPAAIPGSPRREPRWGVRFLLGYDRFGPADVDREYSDGGFRADAQYLRFLRHRWFSGFGLGWRIAAGHPQGAYQTETTLDDPRYSLLQTFELGARAGQRYGNLAGAHFDWLLGPTLALVNETATMTVYDRVTPDSLVWVGERNDGLTRLACGGEVRLHLAWTDTKGDEWGIQAGAFMFAWEGHEEHSLITDFVRSNLHGWDIGITYTLRR